MDHLDMITATNKNVVGCEDLGNKSSTVLKSYSEKKISVDLSFERTLCV